jgi:hypothetical protein
MLPAFRRRCRLSKGGPVAHGSLPRSRAEWTIDTSVIRQRACELGSSKRFNEGCAAPYEGKISVWPPGPFVSVWRPPGTSMCVMTSSWRFGVSLWGLASVWTGGVSPCGVVVSVCGLISVCGITTSMCGTFEPPVFSLIGWQPACRLSPPFDQTGVLFKVRGSVRPSISHYAANRRKSTAERFFLTFSMNASDGL